MLTDCGLMTPEEMRKYEEYFKKRGEDLLNGQLHGGCISALPCSSCNHLISDSICLCSLTFTCPNCGTFNSPELVTLNPGITDFSFLEQDIFTWEKEYGPMPTYQNDSKS